MIMAAAAMMVMMMIINIPAVLLAAPFTGMFHVRLYV